MTITGISGYIGAHVALACLEDGGFKVRGTVRNKDDPAKLEQYKVAFGKHFDKLELVNADLLDDASLAQAIQGSTYVIHVASPFVYGKSDDEVIKPAVDGTIGVLKACQATKVKRCVVTSSCLSVLKVSEANRPAGKFTEAIWSETEACGDDVYSKSKILAEKAAWDFVAALPQGEKFELTCVLPAFVMGPPLMAATGTSVGFTQGVMSGKMPQIPSNYVPAVDVREVAKAHLLAIKKEEAKGKRYMIVNLTRNMRDLAAPLITKYKPLGYPVTESMADIDPNLYEPQFDNSAAKGLGITFRDFNQTMLDMADKMIELGMIQKP